MNPNLVPPSSHTERFIKYWLPVFLYGSLIVFLSSQSHPSQHFPAFLLGMSDKLTHGMEFGLLGILLYRAFHQTHRASTSMGFAILCAGFFGVSDELHQWFVPHRQADMFDVFADILGAGFGILIWWYVTRS